MTAGVNGLVSCFLSAIHGAMKALSLPCLLIVPAFVGCSCGASETPNSGERSATGESAGREESVAMANPPSADQWTLESSQPVVSPSSEYNVVVSSQTYASGEAQSQAVVSGSRGGSGLIAFPAARVSMRFEWRGDDELLVSYPDDLPPPRIDATNTRYGFGGRGRVTYQAVPRSEIPELRWAHEGGGEVSEPESLERGSLVAIEQNGETVYSYSYYDVHEPDSSAIALQVRGFQGGGPSWAGIIYGLVTLRAPTIASEIQLNDEANGLSVESDNRAALIRVAELVAAAKRDPSLLDAAIQRAQADGEME